MWLCTWPLSMSIGINRLRPQESTAVVLNLLVWHNRWVTQGSSMGQIEPCVPESCSTLYLLRPPPDWGPAPPPSAICSFPGLPGNLAAEEQQLLPLLLCHQISRPVGTPAGWMAWIHRSELAHGLELEHLWFTGTHICNSVGSIPPLSSSWPSINEWCSGFRTVKTNSVKQVVKPNKTMSFKSNIKSKETRSSCSQLAGRERERIIC